MRIVDVNAFYAPRGGGVRTYVERKLRALPALGHEVVILAPGERTEIRTLAPGATLATLASPPFALDRRYRHFNDEAAMHAMLDQLRPDWVEASSPWGSAAMVARWQGAAPRSLIMHSDPLSAYAYRWFGPLFARERIDRGFDFFWRHLKRLDQQFDHVIAASRDLSNRLSAGGLHKVRTVPMGVDPGIFSPAHRDAALRRQLLAQCQLDEDATLLLAVGRFAPEKRIPMLVQGAMAAGTRHPIALALVGEGRDERAVRSAIGHCPHIALIPPVRERPLMARLMASADIFIHGCEAETYGMVAAEARASGVPLIVPDSGGASDQAVPGAGLCYRAANPAALAAALGTMIERPLAGYQARAREQAPLTPSMDQHFAALCQLYEAGAALRRAA